MDKDSKVPDRTDRRILAALQANARLTFSELGRKVGLTPPAVRERVTRLEEAGWISGYHAEIPLEKLGLPIQAFLQLYTTPDQYPRVLAAVQKLPEVLECDHVTGEAAFVLKIAAASTARLEEVIAVLSPFGRTETAIVLSGQVRKATIREEGTGSIGNE